MGDLLLLLTYICPPEDGWTHFCPSFSTPSVSFRHVRADNQPVNGDELPFVTLRRVYRGKKQQSSLTAAMTEKFFTSDGRSSCRRRAHGFGVNDLCSAMFHRLLLQNEINKLIIRVRPPQGRWHTDGRDISESQ